MTKEISINEWLAQLEKLDNRKAITGMTSREIAVHTGKGVKWVRDFVRKAMDAGLCEFAGNRLVKDISNRDVNTPQYRFKKASKVDRKNS